MQKLPDKLSELIRVGLADVRKAEQAADTYVVDMGLWHEPGGRFGGNRCHVCMAGAVMAFHLDVPADKDMTPGMLEQEMGGTGSDERKKLRALDQCVWGKIDRALVELGVVVGTEQVAALPIRRVDVPSYEHGREEWHVAMRLLADDLAAAGY